MNFFLRLRKRKDGSVEHMSVTRTPSKAGVRTRFAPSPTGFMHVGNVRSAIYPWIFALQHAGEFVLRIEDTDKVREVEGSIGHIMETLKWLGVKWNEGIDVDGPYGPYLQSDRLEIYRAYARRLISSGHAYPDPYTEEEVEAFRHKAEEEKRPFLYREHRPEHTDEWDGKTPLRFKVSAIKRYEWHDLIMGDLSAGEEALDDFIMIKGDGYPTYNFAHIVDDIEMKISHVMRGQEYISSTPKYLSVYEALGIEPPLYATLPHILANGGGKKLSKRDGAKDLLEYRDEGYLPEAMLNFIALLGWHPSDTEEGSTEVLGRDDLLREFDVERVQRSGAQFDEQKLLYLNREWMRKLTDSQYADLVLERVRRVSHPRDSYEDMGYISMLTKLVPLLKERAHTVKEAQELLNGELQSFFALPPLIKETLTAKESAEAPGNAKKHLEQLLPLVEQILDWSTPELVKSAVMPYADAIPKEMGGRGAALWPLRYALSGAERSPDPFMIISIISPSEAVSRIRKALDILGE